MALKLAGNPWTCDCKLVWVRDWLKHVKAKSIPLMMTINNFNNSRSLSLQLQESEEKLQQALHDVRQGKCIKSGDSLLHVFRNELRDCRRNSASDLDAAAALLPYISLLFLLLCHISFQARF